MYVNDLNQIIRPEIVSGAHGDVNGDGIMDYVFLTAVKSVDPSSPYMTQYHVTHSRWSNEQGAYYFT